MIGISHRIRYSCTSALVIGLTACPVAAGPKKFHFNSDSANLRWNVGSSSSFLDLTVGRNKDNGITSTFLSYFGVDSEGNSFFGDGTISNDGFTGNANTGRVSLNIQNVTLESQAGANISVHVNWERNGVESFSFHSGGKNIFEDGLRVVNFNGHQSGFSADAVGSIFGPIKLLGSADAAGINDFNSFSIIIQH